MGKWDLAELLQDVYHSLWQIKAAKLLPDPSQIWKQVRCFLRGAAFIGATQQLQPGAASAVGDDLPESLQLL